MFEPEVENSKDAAFYVATEVLNEYHAFPVVHRADIGGADFLYIQINDIWFQVEFSEVIHSDTKIRLEALIN
jgi:hypothetical protein